VVVVVVVVTTTTTTTTLLVQVCHALEHDPVCNVVNQLQRLQRSAGWVSEIRAASAQNKCARKLRAPAECLRLNAQR
jgi:hypothetical protein